MSITVLLSMPVIPEHTEAIKAAFKAGLPETRAFDGCQSVEVLEDIDKPGSLLLIQRWDSREDYEKYNAWRAETTDPAAMQAMAAMLAGEYVTTYYDAVAL